MTEKRTQQEISDALSVQIKFLLASSKFYDEGHTNEALRLATAVYTIVHDDRKDASLLTQLNSKNSIQFVASGRQVDPNNLLPETPLVAINFGTTKANFIPILNSGIYPLRYLPFSTWWDEELIYLHGSSKLTRKKLVFVLRSQEGGAHYDPEQKNPHYKNMTIGNRSAPIVKISSGKIFQLRGSDLASMRQIAWELLKTLELMFANVSVAI